MAAYPRHLEARYSCYQHVSLVLFRLPRLVALNAYSLPFRISASRLHHQDLLSAIAAPAVVYANGTVECSEPAGSFTFIHMLDV